MCTKKETFTFMRDRRGGGSMFKSGGGGTYAMPEEYALEDCLDDFCVIRGWQWDKLVKTAVKGGSEWGYFTYKVICPDVTNRGGCGWGLD